MIRPSQFINPRRSAINIARRGLFIVAIALFPFAAQSASAQQSKPRPLPRPSPPQTPLPRGGTITGRVITDDGQPLGTAQVSINPVGVSIPFSNRPLVSIDAQGNFHTSNLAPGSYTVSASAPGYLRAEMSPASLEFGRYQPGDSIIITMKKGGVITGQVMDERGQPVVAASVRAIIKRLEGQYGGGISGGETDDRGVYRIYGLPPGTYLIVVNDYPYQFSPPSPYSRLAPTYYPSSIYETATEITLHLGEELNGLDIRFRGERGHTISGWVTGLGASVPGSYNSLELTLARPNSGNVASYRPNRNASGFAFNGVPDGEYILRAGHEFGGGYGAAAQPRHVTINGADVTGLELPLLPLAAISGRIAVEALPTARRRGACAAARITSPQNTRVGAQLDEKGGTLSDRPYVSFSGVPTGAPNEHGEFTIYKVSPGHFRVIAPSANQPWYIRSITLPGAGKSTQNVGRDGLTFSFGERVTGLTITMAEGAATLRGQAVADKEGARLPSRLQVHAVPTERARADDVLRYAQTYVDPNGKFFFNDLAPGKYWLLLRATPEGVFTARPVAWDSDERAKLRREAEAANIVIELHPCQRVSDYTLRYAPRQ